MILVMYEKILKWYNAGFWNKKQVYDACTKNIITKEQYEKIIS